MKTDKDENDGAFLLLWFSGDKLDPDLLKGLLGLKCVRSTKKGQYSRLGSPKRVRQAPTGYAAFTTLGISTPRAADHVAALILELERKREALNSLLSRSEIDGGIVFFEGDSAGEHMADLDEELLLRLRSFGFPFRVDEGEFFTLHSNSEDPNPASKNTG